MLSPFWNGVGAVLLGIIIGHFLSMNGPNTRDMVPAAYDAQQTVQPSRNQQQLERMKWEMPLAITPLKKRENLGELLQVERLRVGAELGVQRGEFSLSILSYWLSCTKYVLVDVWDHQTNYEDAANVGREVQKSYKQIALSNLRPFKHIVEICHNSTVRCSYQYPDDFFDFVYVDARHDFKGVQQDLEHWWPKVKRGGILAGHDYVTQEEVTWTGQDWTKNYDGTKDKTGTVVLGAVNQFFMAGTPSSNPHYRQVVVTYRESQLNTWMVRK